VYRYFRWACGHSPWPPRARLGPLPASQRPVRRLLGSLVPPSVPSPASSANSTGRALPTGVREMYLNIDTVAAHEPRTASCRFCPPRPGLYRAPSLHLDRRWRRASACCCATRPFCVHLPQAPRPQGPAAYRCESCCTMSSCCAVACTACSAHASERGPSDAD
jgi:hypothetical protein